MLNMNGMNMTMDCDFNNFIFCVIFIVSENQK